MDLEKESWVFGHGFRKRELGFQPRFREKEGWVFGHGFREKERERERESWVFNQDSKREHSPSATFS